MAKLLERIAWNILKSETGLKILERIASQPTGFPQKEVEQWVEYKTEKNEAMKCLLAMSVLGAVTFNGYNWRSLGYTEYLSTKLIWEK